MKTFGEYIYKVDRQGRTTIPAKFRQMFQAGATLLLDPEVRCIRVFPNEVERGWRDGEIEIEGVTYGIFERPLDSRGRIAIPAKLIDYAEIEGAAVFVAGNDRFFELWGEKYWGLEKMESYAEVVARYGN